MTRKRLVLGSLGGTITMIPDAAGTITPQLSADDLVEVVPGLGDVAEIVTQTLASTGSSSLKPSQILAAVQWARSQVDDGADGVVLVQGTDTIEETSYLAELVWDRDEPLVVVGAMRGTSQLSADGPANLLGACRLAASSDARRLGVLVTLDDTIHHASLVYKGHSWGLAAFRSRGSGVLGYIVENQVRLKPFRRPGCSLSAPSPELWPRVIVWSTWLGDDATMLKKIANDADGVVIAGAGAGHVSAEAAEVVEELAARMPVVVATRIAEGGTLSNTYGYPGSETDLVRRGAHLAGILDPLKSRLLLSVLIAGRVSGEVIADEFARRGGGVPAVG